MDQVVAQALTAFKRLRARHERQQAQEISALTMDTSSAVLDDTQRVMGDTKTAPLNPSRV